APHVVDPRRHPPSIRVAAVNPRRPAPRGGAAVIVPILLRTGRDESAGGGSEVAPHGQDLAARSAHPHPRRAAASAHGVGSSSGPERRLASARWILAAGGADASRLPPLAPRDPFLRRHRPPRNPFLARPPPAMSERGARSRRR
ncbi:unnamed protein product, partial [Urochloa humidicola]